MLSRPDNYDGTNQSVCEGCGGYMKRDNRLSISTHVVRIPDHRTVFVGHDRKEDEQLDGFVDALHWHRYTENPENQELRYIFSGHGKRSQDVAYGLAVLWQNLKPEARGCVQILRDFESCELGLPDLSEAGHKRLKQLGIRERADLPSDAVRLGNELGKQGFRWYRTVTGRVWSGRIDGLEVCKLKANGQLTFSVGKTNSPAREAFNSVVREEHRIAYLSDYAQIRSTLGDLAAARAKGSLADREHEHRIQARALRGDISIALNGRHLTPIIRDDEPPFEFPAQWSPTQRSKYIDLIVADGHIPWVVELKDGGPGQGQNYRHAITQAVLYRNFIRTAEPLHEWFQERGLDASSCGGIVAFPTLRGNRTGELRSRLEAIASMFDVRVVELST